MRRSRKPYEIVAAWAALGLPGSLPSSHRVRGQNCTNNTLRYTSKERLWQRRHSGSRDVTGRRTGGLVVPPQIVHPRRGREAAGGVRLHQQVGHLPPHLHGLLRRQVARELVQQAYELADVGRAGHRSAAGEPALELGPRGTSRNGTPQEVAQPVRAHRELVRDAPQRGARGFARNHVPQQGHGQRGQAHASRHRPGAPPRTGRAGRLNRHLTYEDSPPPWVTAQTEHGRYTPTPPEARPPEAVTSSDFSRGFASGRPILTHQVLNPAGGREPPRLVRLGQQPGDVAPQLARLMGARSPDNSFNRRTSCPTLGGREVRPCSASQRSSLARVALRGAEPFRKLRRPLGLMDISRAARRSDRRAVSRATASRSRGTGRVGTPRRPDFTRRPVDVQFVRFRVIYTVKP